MGWDRSNSRSIGNSLSSFGGSIGQSLLEQAKKRQQEEELKKAIEGLATTQRFQTGSRENGFQSGYQEQPPDMQKILGFVAKFDPQGIGSYLAQTQKQRQPNLPEGFPQMQPDAQAQVYNETYGKRFTPFDFTDPQKVVNAGSIPTGNTRTVGKILQREMQDVDPRTNKPLPNSPPRWEPWQDQTTAADTKPDDSWEKAKKSVETSQSYKELTTALNSSDKIGELIDATRAGNQVAVTQTKYALARIFNGTRLSDQDFKVSGVGVSAARKAQDWVNTVLEGRPSEATVEDIQEVASIFARGARGKVNELYGKESRVRAGKDNKKAVEIYDRINPYGDDFDAVEARLSGGTTPTQKKIKQQFISPSTGKRKVIYEDGTEEILDK